jgi:Beta propeller domain
MRRYWKLNLAAIGLVAIAGCNVFVDFFQLFQPETGASDLIAFESEKQLVDYFKDQVVARNSPVFAFDRVALEGAAPVDAISAEGSVLGTDGSGGTDGDAGAAAPQAGGDDADGNRFSETTTQEEGVDESDVIKTDGTYIYMIVSSSDGNSILRITRVFPADQMAVVSETEIEGFGRDIYLRDSKVVAMTSAGGYYNVLQPFEGGIAVGPELDAAVDARPPAQQIDPDGDPDQNQDPDNPDGSVEGGGAASDGGDAGNDEGGVDLPLPFGMGESGFVRPYTIITIIDIADPASPSTLSTTRFDGNVSSSRMIDGVLHLVLANFQSYYINEIPALSSGSVGASDVADVSVSQVVPDFQQEKDGEMSEGDILSWESMFRPTDPDGYGIVTVVSLDVDNDASFQAVAVVAEPGLVYASTEALYLTDTQWDFRGQTRTTTDIYKLAVQNRGVTPVATGSVPGRILNQYSMGEYQGNLRVATTVDRSFLFNGQTIESQNNVYVLGQEAGADGLSIIGSVEGIAPGETIQSARFLGDRGYVVTFLQIDPLFTLDLADPRNPQIIGELKVPGFSTFLTPIDENHILAVGRYIPTEGTFGSWGVQLSIFDVSDFANPVLSSNVIIGEETGADSEAVWNPKAFTYFAENGVVAFPIQTFGGFAFLDDVVDISDTSIEPDVRPERGEDTTVSEEPPPEESVEIIDILDLLSDTFRGIVVFDVSAENGLTERGRISTDFGIPGYSSARFTRGVFIEDRVYAVTNEGIRSAGMDDVDNADQSLTFDSATGDDPITIVEPVPPNDTVTSDAVSAGAPTP